MKLTATIGVVLMTLLFGAAPAPAAVTLPHIIGSHMVLQREMPLRIWGWAEPGEQLSLIHI